MWRDWKGNENVSTHVRKLPQNRYLSKCVQEILRFYQSAFIQTDRHGNENWKISASVGKDTENLRTL